MFVPISKAAISSVAEKGSRQRFLAICISSVTCPVFLLGQSQAVAFN